MVRADGTAVGTWIGDVGGLAVKRLRGVPIGCSILGQVPEVVVKRPVLLHHDDNVVENSDIRLPEAGQNRFLRAQRQCADIGIATAGSAPAAERRTAACRSGERHFRALIEARLASRGTVYAARVANDAAGA